MSTQPIDRRHLRPVVRRRPHLRRAVTIGVLFALTFAAAFVVGHTRSSGATAERLPPSLPKVPTPVSAALSVAPPIQTAVLKPPPVTHPAPPAKTTVETAAPVVTTPAVTTPAAPTEQTPPAVTSTPAPVTPAPAPSVQPSKPAPSHSTPSSGRSGSGTSFESSG